MPDPGADSRRFYLHALQALRRAAIPYLIGGGFALAAYTRINRQTKDLDLFILPDDRDRALAALQERGYQTEVTWSHFLAKAIHGEAFIDLLHNSGNGICPVDPEWFAHAETAVILDSPQPLSPVEENIWSKAFVQDRDRYDGADVAHLLLARGHALDWERLLRRFREHEPVLLAHLVLFAYIFPSEKDRVPQWVVNRLQRAAPTIPPAGQRPCQGTNLAKREYLPDLQRGFTDPRLHPPGPLSAEQIHRFTH